MTSAWRPHLIWSKETIRRLIYATERAIVRTFPRLLGTERNYYRHLHESVTFGPQADRSAVKLSVAYVLAEKDLAVLDSSLKSVRQFLLHPISTVYVISAPSPLIEAFCRKNNCRWVDEKSVIGFGPATLKLKIEHLDRPGWLLQQLIKLSLDKLGPENPVLALDADTVLVSPQIFFSEGRTVMLVSDELHLPYRRTFKRLLGMAPTKSFSFVSHQMVFDVIKLPLLRQEIEMAHPGLTWWEAILKCYDRGTASGFSEFETYGNWISARFPNDVTFEHWANRAIPRNWLHKAAKYQKKWHGSVRSISFHSHTE